MWFKDEYSYTDFKSQFELFLRSKNFSYNYQKKIYLKLNKKTFVLFYLCIHI